MTIQEFIESKQIKWREVKENFELEKEFSINRHSSRECNNCKNKLNYQFLPSQPWTYVQKCNSCRRLIFIIVGDKMAGQEDTVSVFKEKSKK